MTYEKMFSEVQKNFKKAKTTDFTENFAFQFNITGDGEGIFYAAFKDGVLAVEPFDYNDRDVIFETDGKTIIAIASGKMEPIDAIKSGKLSIDGNHELAKQLMFLINTSKAKTSKAAAPKKTAEKKSSASAKASVKKETKSAAAAKAETKPASTKPAAAKPATKTEAKAETKPATKTAVKAEPKSAAKAEAKPAAKKTKK